VVRKIRLPFKEKGTNQQISGRFILSQWAQWRTNDKGQTIKREPGARLWIKGRHAVLRMYSQHEDGKGTVIDQKVLEFKPAQAKRLGKAGMREVMLAVVRIPELSRPIRLDDVRGMAAIEQAIAKAQVGHLRRDKIDKQDLYAGALAGIARQLPDRFSYISHPKQAERHREAILGNAKGIGVWLSGKLKDPADKKKGHELGKDTPMHVKIERTIVKGPARKAGVKKGDVILEVDGEAVLNVEHAGRLLKGPEGTSFKMKVKRGEQIETLTVARGEYDPNPVRTKLKDGVGYVSLPKFDVKAGDKVHEAIKSLQARNDKKPLKGLILDFRNNGGGAVKGALDILNLFVKKGTLFELRGQKGKVIETRDADPTATPFADLPVAFLVNKNSYSASELTAGAMQDLKRALVVGETTGGKGTRMTVQPLANGSEFALVDAQYNFPSGFSPDNVGLKPDVTRDSAQKRHLARGGRKGADYAYEEALHLLKTGQVTIGD
jgi:carboxyl-terminal processing protease